MRLRNTTTDAVVSCTEETAARLGSEWVDADEIVEPAPEPEPETPKAPEPEAPPAPPAPVPAPPKK